MKFFEIGKTTRAGAIIALTAAAVIIAWAVWGIVDEAVGVRTTFGQTRYLTGEKAVWMSLARLGLAVVPLYYLYRHNPWRKHIFVSSLLVWIGVSCAVLATR